MSPIRDLLNNPGVRLKPLRDYYRQGAFSNSQFLKLSLWIVRTANGSRETLGSWQLSAINCFCLAKNGMTVNSTTRAAIRILLIKHTSYKPTLCSCFPFVFFYTSARVDLKFHPKKVFYTNMANQFRHHVGELDKKISFFLHAWDLCLCCSAVPLHI